MTSTVTAGFGPPAGPPVSGVRRREEDPLIGQVLGRVTFPDPESGPVTLAVSGGPDSAALVVLARAAGVEGTVVHVDHGLRPGSTAESHLVGDLAARFGFGFEAHRVTVDPGPDLEARARAARYQVLPPGVLTGHTMDDQAETVLLNLLRGSGLDGFSAMRDGPGRFGRWVRRPLLGLRRAETAAVCRAAGIAPLLDPSNSDPRFRRNRIRSEVLPLLDDVAGRDVVPLLARAAAIAATEVEVLDTLASAIDPLDVAALRSAPAPLARRSLRAWLRSAAAGGGPESHPPSAAELARVMQVVDGHRQACQISGGRRVSRRSGRLSVISPPAPVGPGRSS